MNDESLTQEEIDALLKGSGIDIAADTDTKNEKVLLSEMEMDALGEIANIAMGTAATTLSSLINKKVEITTPKITITTHAQLQNDYPVPYVAVNVQFTEGLIGKNILIMKIHDAGVIVDLMMGGDGKSPPEELNELHLSAIGEAMNQMMGSGATSMSSVFQKRVNISPPSVQMINLAEDHLNFNGNDDNEGELLKVVFRMFIENLIDSEIMQIFPIEFAKQISSQLLAGVTADQSSQPKSDSDESIEDEVLSGEFSESIQQKQQTLEIEKIGETAKAFTAGSTNNGETQSITVQPVQFASLQETSSSIKEVGNLSLLLDVPLEFTVELGRTKKTIKEILDLGPGAVVELDKLAGEAVDIYINGRPIAKGEVVVIDENYGVRITEILSSAERINNLQ